MVPIINTRDFIISMLSAFTKGFFTKMGVGCG